MSGRPPDSVSHSNAPHRPPAPICSDGGDERQETITLGQHLGRAVVVSIRQRPSKADAPDEFAANLYVPASEDVDIFRVDTAHYGCHADRFYLPEDDPRRREDYSVQFRNPDEVFEWLLRGDRWRDFVEQYEANHGLPSRQSGE